MCTSLYIPPAPAPAPFSRRIVLLARHASSLQGVFSIMVDRLTFCLAPGVRRVV